MRAWREIATPHEDVLNGSLRMSDFAADLNLVASGKATPEYQNAEKFFDRTYITEGMKALLLSVAKRILGRDGDPVVQLKTNFGGGKTHSMLAVYHLATRTVPTARLKGVAQILNEARIDELPKAKVAVLVGNNISPNQPTVREGLEIRTMWGLMAYELLGAEGYELVKGSDISGTAPSKELLAELFTRAAPCIVLCDEMVAFMRQLVDPKVKLTAGSFEANITFIQNLTEALKAVPNAMLLASLPQSEEELGGEGGKLALNSLEPVFNRVEAIWKPVGTEESFEIVRRRLFADTGAEAERKDVCRQFFDMYRASPDLFPTEVQESSYLDMMTKTYPIHPELFDRLYTDWSTLQRFQKTRGVLQYMAIVINRLWTLGNTDPLIMPGSLPLSDDEVEKKSTQYLTRTGWSAVIQKEIDGKSSVAGDIDLKFPAIGACQAAQRAARAIYMGSAPSAEAVAQTALRGIDKRRIRLGAAIPGQALGAYDDALDALGGQSHYLNVDRTRYYYGVTPNLRQEMEQRKSQIGSRQALDHLKTVVSSICGRGSYFSGVHVFAAHEDIDDNIGSGPKLVVMRPDTAIAYSRTNENLAFKEATTFLQKRGSSPRARQNRMLFLFPDTNSVGRLLDQCRVYLAWEDILEASRLEKIILDTAQVENAKTSALRAKNQVEVTARQCYHFLLVPEAIDSRTVGFTVERVASQQGSIASSIENYLVENDLLVRTWSPVFLKNQLSQYYFKNGASEVSLKKVWEDTCTYLYLPRLKSEDVFLAAVAAGVKDGSFGYAAGKDGDDYSGFNYREEPLLVAADAGMLLLSKDKAEELHNKRLCPKCGKHPCACGTEPRLGGGDNPPVPTVCPRCGHSPCTCSAPQQEMKRFWGTVELDPVNPVGKLSTVLAEVISKFTLDPKVKVTLKLDISAETPTSFDKNTVVRPVTENCNTLGFSSKGFSA